MKPRLETVQVLVVISAVDHRIYLKAARKLAGILGPRHAPDAQGLIQHELTGRSARGLVDEYLDAVGWSVPACVPPRLPARRQGGPARLPRVLPGALRQPALPADPSRN